MGKMKNTETKAHDEQVAAVNQSDSEQFKDYSPERPADVPNYHLGLEFDHDESEKTDRLPHTAFAEAAAKYFPCQCVIHAYAITDSGTVVVLSAGALGVRKEVIGA